jgi:hypothetical protein
MFPASGTSVRSGAIGRLADLDFCRILLAQELLESGFGVSLAYASALRAATLWHACVAAFDLGVCGLPFCRQRNPPCCPQLPGL